MPWSWPGACPTASCSTEPAVISTLTDEEMLLLGARIRAYHTAGPMGPLAIVVITEHTHGLARLFGALAAADRPIKIFRDLRAARRWLDAQPV